MWGWYLPDITWGLSLCIQRQWSAWTIILCFRNSVFSPPSWLCIQSAKFLILSWLLLPWVIMSNHTKISLLIIEGFKWVHLSSCNLINILKTSIYLLVTRKVLFHKYLYIPISVCPHADVRPFPWKRKGKSCYPHYSRWDTKARKVTYLNSRINSWVFCGSSSQNI